MNNLEETDRKDLIMKIKLKARYLRSQEKTCKKEFTSAIQENSSLKRKIYLKWTERRDDNGWECIATETRPHECSSGPV